MPIQENVSLLECERVLEELLDSIEALEQSNSTALAEPIKFHPRILLDNENDKKCAVLCEFYLKLIHTINKSLELKETFGGRIASVLNPPEEHASLIKLKDSLLDYCFQLVVKHSELKEILCYREVGKRAIYFIIYTALVNAQPNNSPFYSYLGGWISEFTSDEKHQLAFITNLISKKYEILTGISESLRTNPYYSFLYDLEHVHTKEKFIEILQTKFLFSGSTPQYIKNFIKQNFSYWIIKKIFQFGFEADELLTIFETIDIKQLFPQKKFTELKTTEEIIQLFFLAYSDIRAHAKFYSLSYYLDFLFVEFHHDIPQILLKLYQSFQVSGYFHPDTIYPLTKCCSNMILEKSYYKWGSNPGDEKYFWEIAGLVFNIKGPISKDIIELMSLRIHALIDNLTHFGFIHQLLEILNTYIEYNKIDNSITKTSKKQFQVLFQILKFFCLLAELKYNLENEDVQHLLVIKDFLGAFKDLSRDMEGLNKLHIKKLWPKLPGFLTSFTLDHLKNLNQFLELKKLNKNDLDILYELQKFCHQIFNLADVSQPELSLLQTFLKNDELGAIQTKALIASFESSKKPKLKSKTAQTHQNLQLFTTSSSLASQSLFATHMVSSLHVALEDMPVCLVELATKIKSKFNINLILSGGAVTNFLLKQPNHNDFDCLVFNLNLAELHQFLITSGYENAVIVGRHYPIIKIKIQTNKKIFDIDLTSVNVPHYLSLQDQMAEILSTRDFKMSALYIDLILTGHAFEIKGFDHAIHSVNLKQIAAVRNAKRKSGESIFTEDPLRAFRLIKLMLKYPDFVPDSQLMHIMKKHPFKTLFTTFLSKDLNQARIGTIIESLFKHFDAEQVVEKLGVFGILEGLTGLSYEKIKIYIPHLHHHISTKLSTLYQFNNDIITAKGLEPVENIPYLKKLALYQFLLICFCLESPHVEFYNWMAFGLISKIRSRDEISLEICQAISEKNPELLVVPCMIKFLADLMNEYEAKQSKTSLKLSF